MVRKGYLGVAAAALLRAALSTPPAHAGITRVLLISVDGMHAVDLANCSKAGTCPNLSTLAKTGINYVDTSASKPSDSFPCLMALVTAGSPRSVAAFYDVAYDRSLAPPQIK